ncbi:hypothetical protein ACS0TY_004247 [Phlomoides rotata]
MEIELCKRRSISKGKRSKLREYEKPAKRQECILIGSVRGQRRQYRSALVC